MMMIGGTPFSPWERCGRHHCSRTESKTEERPDYWSAFDKCFIINKNQQMAGGERTDSAQPDF